MAMKGFFVAGVLGMASIAAGAPATQPDLSTLKPNDPVMVREGDQWSKVTFVAREGRRYQIRYDDGTTEWVTAERLQTGTTPPVGGAPATKPGAPAAPAKPAWPTFTNGQNAEVKWHGLWQPVKIINKRGEWYLVEYTQRRNYREWAEPWRLRTVGSDYDNKEMNLANPRLTNNEGPPRPTPGDPPVKRGPIAGQPGAPDAEKQDDPFAPPSTGLPVAEVKVAPPVVNPTPPGGWKLTPGVLPATAKLPATLKAGYLPPLEFGIGWGTPQLTGTRVMVPVAQPNGNKRQAGLVRVNVMTGGVEKFELNSASAPMALSPSGDMVLCRSNGFHGRTKSRLDLYKLGAPPQHIISFSPFGKEMDIEQAFWIDDKFAILVTHKNVSCWEVATGTGKWQMEISQSQVARSPDGKQLAVATALGLVILNVDDGSTLALLEGEKGFGDLAISGDGLRLIRFSQPTLKIWDLQTGQLDETVAFSGPIFADPLVAPNKDFVLLGRGLFSLRKKNFVWQYDGQGSSSFASDRIWTIGGDGNKKYVTSAVIPHPKALAAAQQMPQAPLVLKPGSGITLDLQIDGEEADKRDQIVAAMTKQLTDAGLKVADGQPIRVTVRTEDGPTQTRQYTKRQFGRPGGGETETVTITSKITKLTLEKEGKTIWQTSRSVSNDPGSIVSLKEGETIQDKAKMRSPTYMWLTTTPIPTSMREMTDVKSVPASTFGLGGIVDKQ